MSEEQTDLIDVQINGEWHSFPKGTRMIEACRQGHALVKVSLRRGGGRRDGMPMIPHAVEQRSASVGSNLCICSGFRSGGRDGWRLGSVGVAGDKSQRKGDQY